MTEVELVSGGLAVSLPGDRPAMLRGLSLRHDGPAVLIVDEASRVRDELWATISPMLAAAPAAQQILLSTPAGASGEFHRAWTSGEDWERVQVTADQCPRISAAHLAAERVRLGDALYSQEYFGAFVSAPGSVFDAEVLAHMFGDHTEEEPEEPAIIVQGRIADRFLHVVQPAETATDLLLRTVSPIIRLVGLFRSGAQGFDRLDLLFGACDVAAARHAEATGKSGEQIRLRILARRHG